MNSYLAKRKDHQQNLLAAKERFKNQLGIQTPAHPVKPYSAERDNAQKIFRRRVDSVKRLPQEEIDRLVHTRQIYAVIGIENMAPINRNRMIHAVLATAGKATLRAETIIAMKEIKRGIASKRKTRDEPYLSMLEAAGIVELRKFKGGSQKIIIRDKKRLEKTIDDGRIVW